MRNLTFFTAMPAILLGIVMGAGITPVFAVDSNGLFELEGNAIDDSVTPPSYDPLPDDWQTVNNGYGDESVYAFIVDMNGEPDYIFTGGGSKTPNDPEDWLWKQSPPPPDKDNIAHAFAANYMDGSDQIIYFGADLFADNGDAELAFWFFQDDVSRAPGGIFDGHHIDRDVYVAVKFSNGGTNATITVYEWWADCDKAVKNPLAGDCAADNIRVVWPESEALCGGSGGHLACAITNEFEEDSVWEYVPKSGTFGTYPPTTFFEGGINISAMFGNSMCFSSFMATTGASTSFTSTAKDFALGAFDVCSVLATKNCRDDIDDDVPGVPAGLKFNVRGCAINSGAADIKVTSIVNSVTGDATAGFNDLAWYLPPSTFDPDTDCIVESELVAVTGIPTAIPPVSGSGTLVDPSNQVLAAGEALVYYFKESTNLTQPSDTVTIDAEGAWDGAEIEETTAGATCPQHLFPVDISVDKSCTSDLETQTDPARVVVKINFSGQVCNNGDVDLTGLYLEDDTPKNEPVYFDTYPDVLAAGNCTPYSGYYYPEQIPAEMTCPFADQIKAWGYFDADYADPSSMPTCTAIGGGLIECYATSNSPTCLLRALGDGNCATGQIDPPLSE